MSWKSSTSAGSFRTAASVQPIQFLRLIIQYPRLPLKQPCLINSLVIHSCQVHPWYCDGMLNPWNHGCISFKPMTHSLETHWPWSFFSGSCLRSAVVLIADLPYPNVFGWLTCRNECCKICRIPGDNIHRLGLGIHARITPIQSPLQADVWETSNTSAKALRSNEFSKISMDAVFQIEFQAALVVSSSAPT